MVSPWRKSDSKSPQVSRTLLSNLAELNNAVVWLVSTIPLTSKFSSPFTIPLVTVSSAQITIGIKVTFMFHSFFSSLAKVRVLFSLFAFFQFYFVISQDGKVYNSAVFFFFCCWLSLAETRWSVCISKFQRTLCDSFSWTVSWLCIYQLFVWSDLNFLPTLSCLVL